MEQENNKKVFNNTPMIESKVSKSKDGRFIIHKTIITDIRPVAYYQAALRSDEQ